jgi:hypothetical protein
MLVSIVKERLHYNVRLTIAAKEARLFGRYSEINYLLVEPEA